MAIEKAIGGCRLRLSAGVAVSVALNVYPRDAVPHVARSGHAPEGCSMKVAISIWIPKSSVIFVITRFGSRKWLIRGPEM